MITKAVLLSLILLLMVSPQKKARDEGPGCPLPKVIEIGQFHGSEVNAQSGEEWLGLHISDDGSLLLNYKLTVKTVTDDLRDGPNKKTGKEVSVDLPLEPLFLVQADGVLKAGGAQTIYDESDGHLRERQPLKFSFADVTYKLEVVSPTGEKCDADSLPKNARLVLSSDNHSQVLYTLEDCGSDPSWYVIWTGDIDSDNKLDLYVNVTQHYNVSERILFLSSTAHDNELVRELARLVTTGC